MKEKIDKIINIIAIVSAIILAAGLIIAIWFGVIGIKIAGTALIIILCDAAVAWILGDRTKNAG